MRRWLGLSGLALCLCLGALIWSGTAPVSETGDRPLPRVALAPEPPVNLVTFGTSLTALVDWPAQFETKLSDCLGRPVTVTPVARPGAGSAWALTQVDRVRDLAPDLVVIEFAINDADVLDGLWPKASFDTHDRLIRRLRQDRPDLALVLMTMNPVTGLQRLKRPALARYYAAYGDLADRHDTGLLDMTPRWQTALDQGLRLPDGLHPARADAARLIVPPLTRLVAAGLGQPCPDLHKT